MGTAGKGGDVISVDEERDGVSLTNLGEPLFSGAGVTKRDLVDYLDAVRGQLIPELSGRPLSVVRVLRGQEAFMQKNVPKYTPPWVRTIRLWAESSRREVSYALCDDRRTLLWFANQRAVEYHPTLSEAGQPDRPDYLVLDIDPPAGGEFRPAVLAAQLVREALAGCGLAGAVKTSGAKGVHVFVPITGVTAEDAAAATRAVAARAQRLDPALTTTAFIRADRDGKVFLDSTRAGGATVVAAYSPRVRPGVPVSFPVSWDELDRVTPADFTVRTAAALIPAARPGPAGRASCRRRSPSPTTWSPRATRSRWPGSRPCTRASGGPVPAAPRARTRRPGIASPARRARPLAAVAPGTETQPAEHQQRDPQPPRGTEPQSRPVPDRRPEERRHRVPGHEGDHDEQHDRQQPGPWPPGPGSRRRARGRETACCRGGAGRR